MKMTYTFLMGSPENEKGRQKNEGPQHEVTISKRFYMGIYPVTQEPNGSLPRRGLAGRFRLYACFPGGTIRESQLGNSLVFLGHFSVGATNQL
jgi:hypothetical protein